MVDSYKTNTGDTVYHTEIAYKDSDTGSQVSVDIVVQCPEGYSVDSTIDHVAESAVDKILDEGIMEE